MSEIYKHYGLDSNTQAFVGHALALHLDDSYLERPAIETVEKVKLYAYSLERYGKSPYLYPIYGLGGLPEGFSRLCAIHGGTFMLNTPIQELLFDDRGKAWGLKCTDPEDNKLKCAKAPMIIGDPSYFSADKLTPTGKVIRSICFLDHPVEHTKDSESCQIIIPAKQVEGKNNDIYICVVSAAHCVAAKGKWIAIVSTEVETDDPLAEIKVATDLLGPVLERFDDCVDRQAPVADGTTDGCYISQSYDATSHFETVANDVLDMHVRVFGGELDMTISADSTDADENQ
jgi:Rab GDP dissociation inhibitor